MSNHHIQMKKDQNFKEMLREYKLFGYIKGLVYRSVIICMRLTILKSLYIVGPTMNYLLILMMIKDRVIIRNNIQY
jgi:hypothetical protein